MKVSAVILTLEEEPRIEECLKQLRPHIDYILVLDGESTDRTVEIAKRYADAVKIKKPSGNIAKDKNYAWSLVPKEFEWTLFVDADERWDQAFLRNMKTMMENHNVLSFRFPRINLPTAINYPDYQVRLLKNDGSIEWRRPVHEIPYHKPSNKPVDQVSTLTLLEYPIIHLPRRKDLKRRWWEK